MDIFLYTVDPTADEPVMLINNFIGFDEEKGYGILGNMFQQELLALDAMDKKSIKIYINSPGGSVFDGMSIYSSILKSKTPVDTYCVGMAASIAGVIFQAGRNRIMADYSKLMYHNPSGGDDKSLNVILDSLVTMITTRTGKDEKEVRSIMARETWIDSQEALEAGFCDKIEDSGKINVKRKINNAQEATAFFNDAYKIVNNLFDIKNNSQMDNNLLEINNKLGLSPAAAHNHTLAAVDGLINKAKEAEEKAKKSDEELDKAKNSLKEKEDKLKEKEQELKDLKAEIEKEKAAKEEQEKKDKAKNEAEKMDKAKNLITGFVQAGKIKNDAKTIADWTAKAVDDYDGIKDLISGLPVNKAAVKIEVKDSNKQPFKGSLIAATMAKNLADITGIK